MVSIFLIFFRVQQYPRTPKSTWKNICHTI